MRPSRRLLIARAIVALALTVMLTGCVDTGSKDQRATAPSSSPMGTMPASRSGENQTGAGTASHTSEVLTPLAAWWDPHWSADCRELDVEYTKGRNTLFESVHVGTSYTPFGDPIAGSGVKYLTGEDIYGRAQNVTIGVLAGWHATVKPDTVVAYGTVSAPATFEFENAWFTRSLNVTVTCDYDENGKLTGGSGNESFSGHMMTGKGKITYAGTATATFSVKNGALVWTDRTEKTRYYYDGEQYAETVAVITPESEYRGGSLVKMRETVQTTTSYADGTYRESEIVLVWQRNAAGVTSGRSGSGTVRGAEMVNGKAAEYTGAITLDYGFDPRIGWFKTGYHEERSAEMELPTRLPFEVLFVDDLYLRPVF